MAGIEEHRGTAGLVRVQHRHPARRHCDISPACLVAAHLDGAVHGEPGRIAAVEHPDIAVPGPAQRPPGPRGGQAVPVVVDHDRATGAYARAPQRDLEPSRIRQRVTSGGPGRTAEIVVQVEKAAPGTWPAS